MVFVKYELKYRRQRLDVHRKNEKEYVGELRLRYILDGRIRWLEGKGTHGQMLHGKERGRN